MKLELIVKNMIVSIEIFYLSAVVEERGTKNYF